MSQRQRRYGRWFRPPPLSFEERSYVSPDELDVDYDEAFGPVDPHRLAWRREAWEPASDACEADPELEAALTRVAAVQQGVANVHAFNAAELARCLREVEEHERRTRHLEQERLERASAHERARRKREREAEAGRRQAARQRKATHGGWRMPSKAEMAERRLREAELEAERAARAAERARQAAEAAASAAARAGASPRLPNRYGQACSMCGLWVEPQAGELGFDSSGGWVVRHVSLEACRAEWRRTGAPVPVPERSGT